MAFAKRLLSEFLSHPDSAWFYVNVGHCCCADQNIFVGGKFWRLVQWPIPLNIDKKDDAPHSYM